MTITGAVVLLAGLASCTTPKSGGGVHCTAATPVIGGTPLTVPTTGWYSSDTRSSGNVEVSAALPAPPGYGCNSVHLTTGATLGQDKAQLFSYDKVGQPLASITNVSYMSYKKSPSPGPATVAINIQVSGSTVTTGFSTLVYEPYLQSTGNAGVLLDTWQTWNATATTPGDGLWWSSKITSGPGSMSDPKPWSYWQATYSDATLGGYGFNVGSYNPNQDLGADALTVNATTTDF
jgi:hypothetical protein